MKIQSAHSPAWMDEEQTIINLWVKFEEFDEELPFTAIANDVEEHGRELFTKALGGDYGAISDYELPTTNE